MLHIRCALKPKKNARITIWRILSIIHFSLQLCSAYGKQKTLSLQKERSPSGVSIHPISFLYCCFFVNVDVEKRGKMSLPLCCSYTFGAKKNISLHIFHSYLSVLNPDITSLSTNLQNIQEKFHWKALKKNQFVSEEIVWAPIRLQVSIWFTNISLEVKQ